MIIILMLSLDIEKSRMHNMTAKMEFGLQTARILYYLAWFDRSTYFIPGESAIIKRQRTTFTKFGGLIALIDAAFNSQNSEIKNYCKEHVISRLNISDVKICLSMINFIQFEQKQYDMLLKRKELNNKTVYKLNDTSPSFGNLLNSKLFLPVSHTVDLRDTAQKYDIMQSKERLKFTDFQDKADVKDGGESRNEGVGVIKKVFSYNLSPSASESRILGHSPPDPVGFKQLNIPPIFPRILIERIQNDPTLLLGPLQDILLTKIKS